MQLPPSRTAQSTLSLDYLGFHNSHYTPFQKPLCQGFPCLPGKGRPSLWLKKPDMFCILELNARDPFRHQVWQLRCLYWCIWLAGLYHQGGLPPTKESGLRHRVAVQPTSRKLPKSGTHSSYFEASMCTRMEVMSRGGKFEGGSAAEVRLHLTPQGRLDARQKGPFDSIKGANSPFRTL